MADKIVCNGEMINKQESVVKSLREEILKFLFTLINLLVKFCLHLIGPNGTLSLPRHSSFSIGCLSPGTLIAVKFSHGF